MTFPGFALNFMCVTLREIDKPQGIPTTHPLSCKSTANSCQSLAQRQLPQLPNISHDQPDSPFYNIVQQALQINMYEIYKT